MINVTRFQLWTSLLVCVFALLFAGPNFLPEKTAKSLPSYVPHQQFNLGLDLQGGVYLLLEADMKPVLEDHLRELRNQLRTKLRDERLRYEELRIVPRGVSFRVVDRATLDKAQEAATRIGRDSGISGGSFASRQNLYEIRAEGDAVTMRLTDAGIAAINDRVMEQAMATLRKRIDPEEVREVTVQRAGATNIIVEVPGVSDTGVIKDRIGTTAKMTFHLVHPSIIAPGAETVAPPGYKLLKSAKGAVGEAAYHLVAEEPALDGRHLTNAQQSFQEGLAVIQFQFDTAGARIFCKITQENIKKPFAIVLDNAVLSAPVIEGAICGGTGIIRGNFNVTTATELSLLLRAGALPAPLKVVEERTIGATLGADAIEAGIWASMLGVVLVAVYMITAYGLFGVFAIVALSFNLIILAAIMSMLGATLTLPGIAGIVLSLGMSVDANVLIYERMREEIRAGRTTLSAIDAGFRRAFTAISDSNITSILAGVLLYLLGAGPVKGFGVTLAIGVGASFFTAVMLTRIQVVFWWRWTRPKKLPIVRATAPAAA